MRTRDFQKSGVRGCFQTRAELSQRPWGLGNFDEKERKIHKQP